MRIFRTFILRTLVLAATVFFMACDDLTGGMADLPPFIITKPVMETNERTNHYTYAGIAFKFMNRAEERIDRITVSFMLFDTNTQGSAFTGNNRFDIAKSDMIFPGENKELFISLDNYIYTAPTEPYLFDFFYISEIHYTNGGGWEDRQGKYRVRF